jgi:hypothetical protein
MSAWSWWSFGVGALVGGLQCMLISHLSYRKMIRALRDK